MEGSHCNIAVMCALYIRLSSLRLTNGVLVATGDSLHTSIHHGIHLPRSELLGVLQTVPKVGACFSPSVQVSILCGKDGM